MRRVLRRDPADPKRRVPTLMVTKEQWQHINNEINHLQIESEALAKEKKEIEEDRNLSRLMKSTWKDTIANLRKMKDEMRTALKRQVIIDRQERYKKLILEEQEIKENLVKKAEDSMFLERSEIKAATRAVQFAEILRERDAQIKFNQKIQDTETKRKNAYDKKILEDVEKFRKSEEEKKNKLLENKLLLKAESKKKYDEMIKKREEEKKERQEEERLEAELIMKETERIKQHDLNKARKRVESSWKDIAFNKKMIEKNKLMENEATEEEKTYIQMVAEAKKKLAILKEKRMTELQAAKFARQQQVAKKIIAAAESKELEEEQTLKWAKNQMDEEAEEVLAKKKAYHERLINDRKESYKQYLQHEQERKRTEQELNKWEMLQRIKRSEINDLWKKKLDELGKKTQREFKAIWLKQWEEDKKKRLAETSSNEKENLENKWREADKRYFNQIDKYRADCKKEGRTTLPLEKCVFEYKKENNLREIKKPHFIFESKVPIPKAPPKPQLTDDKKPESCEGETTLTRADGISTTKWKKKVAPMELIHQPPMNPSNGLFD